MDKRVVRCLALAAGLMAPAAMAGKADEALTAVFARYLAEGRGDAEIHLVADAGPTLTRTARRPDGSVSCHVSGLGAGVAGSDVTPALVARLIHEVTHCQVGPYVGVLRGHPRYLAGLDGEAADLLLLLAEESIADARAVLEVHRRDGPQAAAALVGWMRPYRLRHPDGGHATAAALSAALARARQVPQAMRTAQQAFDTALAVGQASALAALRSRYGPSAPGSARAQAERDLHQALAEARAAYRHGRHANDAFTLRHELDQATAGDTHVFLGPGGARTVPVLGAEGAHSLTRLAAVLAEPDEPQALAAQWLRREGRLDVHALAASRVAIANFTQSMGPPDPADGVSPAQAVGEVLRGSPRGADLGALLELAADRLSAARVGWISPSR